MRRALPWVLAGLVAAILIAGVIFYVVVVRPWVAMPDEPRDRIEARFAKVEALAELPEHCRADNSMIIEAIDELQSSKADIYGIVWPRDEKGRAPEVVQSRDPASLPAEMKRAIDNLLEWDRNNGGFGHEPCDDSIAPIKALNLGELALATADAGREEPRLRAILHLARDLRTCGSLIEGRVGFTLARRVAEWGKDRGAPSTDAFHRFRPHAEEVLPLLAREAVCSVRLAEGAYGSSDGETYSAREVLMLEQYYANLLEQASKTPTDLAKISEAIDHEAPDELPPSLLVRAMTLTLSSVVESTAEDIDAYDSFLKASRAE